MAALGWPGGSVWLKSRAGAAAARAAATCAGAAAARAAACCASAGRAHVAPPARKPSSPAAAAAKRDARPKRLVLVMVLILQIVLHCTSFDRAIEMGASSHATRACAATVGPEAGR